MKRSALWLISVLAVSCSGTDAPPNPEVCIDISGTVSAGSLAIRKPESEADGCRGIDGATAESRVCEKKAPDLGCLATAVPLGTPISVTYVGCVSSFGLEAQSDGLVVTILNEKRPGGQDTDPGYDLGGPTNAQVENTPDAVVGRTISTTAPETLCTDRGQFTLENVPTETRMIARVTDQNVENARRTYIDTYQYNVVLRNSAIRQGPEVGAALVTDPATYCANAPCFVRDDVNTVVEQTFKTVALTAGVSRIDGDNNLYDGVGQGHIAGEIQDCTSEDTIKNAVVAVSSPIRKLAYFNVDYPPSIGNLEDPKVDQSRTRTNADGLYAAIAVDTQDGGQAVTIGAAITTSICGDDGICRCEDGAANPAYPGADENEAHVEVLGSRQIYVFPDSITILTFDRNIYTAE